MNQPAVEFNRLKDCRHGRMLYNVNDEYVGRSLDLYGEFSDEETRLLRQLIRPGDFAFDIGANIGALTIVLAQAAGPTGGVFAFEPQRLAFQVLCANAALNSLDNIHALRAACGSSSGPVRIPRLDPARRQNFGAAAVDSNTPGEIVAGMRADDVNVPNCRLIKIDVEGMELEVLKGCEKLIDRFSPILYVENDRQEKSRPLVRFIDSLGYDQYWHVPPLYNSDNFFHNPTNVFGELVSVNMLCLKRGMHASAPSLSRVTVPRN